MKFVRVLFRLVKASELSLKKYIFIYIYGVCSARLLIREIQKIAFIRLISQNRQIYIMDEPSSALDGDSENKMIHLIDKYLRGKTCMIITHRKAILEICDRVVELC